MSETPNFVERIALVSSIRAGEKVTILVSNGIGRNGTEWKPKTGRAVICSGTHAALNMGGPHGTPGVATPKNIVSVKSGRKKLTVAIGAGENPDERKLRRGNQNHFAERFIFRAEKFGPTE